MGQHERNIQGLQQAAKIKQANTKQRAEKTLEEMIKQNEAITFSGVARKAGVSTAWLYRQESICQRIQTLRPHNLLPQPSKVAASQQMKAIYATLKKRLKVVEAENLELKKQLEVLYGVLHKNDKNK